MAPPRAPPISAPAAHSCIDGWRAQGGEAGGERAGNAWCICWSCAGGGGSGRRSSSGGRSAAAAVPYARAAPCSSSSSQRRPRARLEHDARPVGGLEVAQRQRPDHGGVALRPGVAAVPDEQRHCGGREGRGRARRGLHALPARLAAEHSAANHVNSTLGTTQCRALTKVAELHVLAQHLLKRLHHRGREHQAREEEQQPGEAAAHQVLHPLQPGRGRVEAGKQRWVEQEGGGRERPGTRSHTRCSLAETRQIEAGRGQEEEQEGAHGWGWQRGRRCGRRRRRRRCAHGKRSQAADQHAECACPPVVLLVLRLLAAAGCLIPKVARLQPERGRGQGRSGSRLHVRAGWQRGNGSEQSAARILTH